MSDSTLEGLSQFKLLSKLTIMGAPSKSAMRVYQGYICRNRVQRIRVITDLNSGSFLVSVAEQCPRLTSLRVGFLGSALNSHLFYAALKKMTSLLDLR